jgi:hypothetical protein
MTIVLHGGAWLRGVLCRVRTPLVIFRPLTHHVRLSLQFCLAQPYAVPLTRSSIEGRSILRPSNTSTSTAGMTSTTRLPLYEPIGKPFAGEGARGVKRPFGSLSSLAPADVFPSRRGVQTRVERAAQRRAEALDVPEALFRSGGSSVDVAASEYAEGRVRGDSRSVGVRGYAEMEEGSQMHRRKRRPHPQHTHTAALSAGPAEQPRLSLSERILASRGDMKLDREFSLECMWRG